MSVADLPAFLPFPQVSIQMQGSSAARRSCVCMGKGTERGALELVLHKQPAAGTTTHLSQTIPCFCGHTRRSGSLRISKDETC